MACDGAAGMKSRHLLAALFALAARSTLAGELDLDLGAQAATTAWPGDHGGGAALAASWWFRPWIGAAFIGKEQYATVDDRVLSYFSFNAAARQPLGRFRLVETLGIVHQHEEPRSAIMAQPYQSLFGVGDGIRHRMAGRAGLELAWPFHAHDHGDYYVALELDGTLFADTDRGPRWMTSAGLAIGFSYDWSKK
jgi:hypothetical protein